MTQTANNPESPPSNELTKKQKQAVKVVDAKLTQAGLTTYSQMEDQLFAALFAAHEAVGLGKKLMRLVPDAEKKEIPE